MAHVVARRDAHEAANQVIDHLRGVLRILRQHHLGQMQLRGVARNRLHAFEGQLRAAETAVAGVEVLVAIGGHVGFGHLAGLGVGVGGGGDVHALADAVGHAADFFAGGVRDRAR